MNKITKLIGIAGISALNIGCNNNGENEKPFDQRVGIVPDSLYTKYNLSDTLSNKIGEAESFNYNLINLAFLLSGGKTSKYSESNIFSNIFDKLNQNSLDSLVKLPYGSIKGVKLSNSDKGSKIIIDYSFHVSGFRGFGTDYSGNIEIYQPEYLKNKGLILLRVSSYGILEDYEKQLKKVIPDFKDYIYQIDLKNPQNEFGK